MLVMCWHTVYNAGLTLTQYWINVCWYLSMFVMVVKLLTDNNVHDVLVDVLLMLVVKI